MDLGLTGAAVLVTGGSRGLGKEIALSFAREGASVAVCAREREELGRTAAEITALGVRSLAIPADLARAADCQRAIEECVGTFGRIDVLVNNASTAADITTPDAAEAMVMERLVGKTLAAVRCSRAAMRHMTQQRSGRIICIGGTAARAVFRPEESPVSEQPVASGMGNAALANYARHLAEEAAPHQITVNVVHPHIMRTARLPARIGRRAEELGMSEADLEARIVSHIPIGRLIEVTDVAALVLFLASRAAGAITGQAIAVDGGGLRQVNY